MNDEHARPVSDADLELRGLLIGTAIDNTGDPAKAATILLAAGGQVLAAMIGNERAAEIMADAARGAAALCAPAGNA